MKQSAISPLPASPLHVAIIMDGNGRWASQRSLPRSAGHRKGVEAIRRVVEAAPDLGITTLTLYTFSEDNWQRPRREVAILMQLLRRFLEQEAEHCRAEGVRLEAIGRRDRLAPALLAALEHAEKRTAEGQQLHLRLAIDYSSRNDLLRAARRFLDEPASQVTEERISAALGPDVDLLIRTGGEQRLSDFLLWECAYAEFVFSPLAWPEFGASHLAACMDEFQRRDRRFGGLTGSTARKSA